MTVNIHTEWGPLTETIVGSVFNMTPHNIDLSFKLFFNDNIKDIFVKNSSVLQEKIITERQNDLDNLAITLEALGIIVHRPDKLMSISKFTTPYFEDYYSPCDNPRDQVLVLGNKIIETPCIWRKRYFENDLLKNIFSKKSTLGADWIVAPKPLMKDESFDLEYARKSKNINIDWNHYDQLDKKFEMMFDGAQCLKFGEDIIMNVANENHKMGLRWLESIIGDTYRIHPVTLCDHHIDSMFMPLAPGKLLINPESMLSQIEQLPKALQKWDRIMVPEKCLPSAHLHLASANIYTNVLPLGNNRIMVFSEEHLEQFELVKTLERNNFEVVHVRLRHSRLFGGGAHCVTLDLNRDEKLENYFS
jgi:glycine amidinotransferase